MTLQHRYTVRSTRFRALPLTALALVLAMAATACSGGSQPSGDAPDEGLDLATLSWSPERLQAAAPGLVGWRTDEIGLEGRLVSLPTSGPESVIWSPPANAAATVRIEEVDPRGRQMYGVTFRQDDPGRMRGLIFRENGTVEALPLPPDFEGVSSADFVGEDLLVVAYSATPQDYRTTLGLVDPANTWHELTFREELPDHQFVESLIAIPGTNRIAVVLKLPGGTGNRDDDVMVLVERDEYSLRVVSDPYWDDSLPGCIALTGADGVAFGRMWSEPEPGATQYVTATWDGEAWSERPIAPPNDPPVLMERGLTLAQDPSGTFWIRRVTPDTGEAATALWRFRADGAPAGPSGVDVTAVSWFAWVAES